MYFSRIVLRKDASASELMRKMQPTAGQAHGLIWDLFSDGPDRERDFIYRFEMRRGQPRFFAVSERRPMSESRLWKVETKPYDPVLHQGEDLSFLMRVNPVITRHDDSGKHKRHDMVMDIKLQARESGQSLEGDLPTIAACKWLSRRADRYGFVPMEETVTAESHETISFYKRKGSHPVSISIMDISGTLRVADADAFREVLLYGLGPAKAYGCGLVMVKRA
mgnify:CR=1 FL=1